MNSPLSTALISRSQNSNLSKLETSPSPYLDNRVIKSQRESKRTRSQMARARLQTKEHLATLAGGIHEPELADKLRRCHSRLSVLTCGRHIAQIIPNFTCEFRLCPDCGRRRSRRLQNKYLPMMRAFLRHHHVTPVHLVLTQTHRKETRKQSAKRIKDAFTKLHRNSFWKEFFKGGTWSLEFTKDKNGLHHTHLHIIGFRRKFFDIELLRSEWLAVTGDSHVLNLKPILDIAAGLREVVKYVSKPLDIRRFGAGDLREFFQAFGHSQIRRGRPARVSKIKKDANVRHVRRVSGFLHRF